MDPVVLPTDSQNFTEINGIAYFSDGPYVYEGHTIPIAELEDTIVYEEVCSPLYSVEPEAGDTEYFYSGGKHTIRNISLSLLLYTAVPIGAQGTVGIAKIELERFSRSKFGQRKVTRVIRSYDMFARSYYNDRSYSTISVVIPIIEELDSHEGLRVKMTKNWGSPTVAGNISFYHKLG